MRRAGPITFAALGAGAALVLGLSSAKAQLVVFDPKSVAQEIQQLNAAVQQVQYLQQQLQNQYAMLQKIGLDISPILSGLNQAAQTLLNGSQGLGYSSTNLAGLLDSAYPKSLQGQSPAQLAGLLAQWSAASRQAILESMQTQNQAAISQGMANGAVAAAVAASNGAPGGTAAIQATNQLLSALSAQFAQIQNILITQQRQAETLALHQQSVTAKAQADSVAGLAHVAPAPQFTKDAL